MPLLTDDQRYILHSDKFVLMVNFPYEQFRFIVNQPGGSIRNAVTLMQEAIAASEIHGAKFCMLDTGSPMCCDLANLGAFQIRLTLQINLAGEQFSAFQQQLTAKYEQTFLGMEVTVQL